MDTKDMQGHSGHEGCGLCGHGMEGMCKGGHWKHVAIRIFVVLLIFWLGVQFGELRGMLRAGYASCNLVGSYDRTGGYDGWPNMMGGWFRGTAAPAQ